MVITHAGLNTVLETLSQGVPMTAIPVANDQPGVAARLAWLGAGKVVPLAGLRADRLRTAVQSVLEEPRYRRRAADIQRQIQALDGVRRAADIAELGPEHPPAGAASREPVQVRPRPVSKEYRIFRELAARRAAPQSRQEPPMKKETVQ